MTFSSFPKENEVDFIVGNQNIENSNLAENDSNVMLLNQFYEFCRSNPLKFQEEQLNAIRQNIVSQAHGLVCDEYVEFILWTKGLKSRQEYFAEYIEKLFSPAKYHKLLEVGCGRTARLSKLLSDKGYEMTAMDPLLEKNDVTAMNGLICLQCDEFVFGQTDVSVFDAVVAQEPCDATEHIIRACIEQKKNFIISLCGAPHRLMSGEMLDDVYEWYLYLSKIDEEHCFLVNPKYIPGYMTYVLIGIFS